MYLYTYIETKQYLSRIARLASYNPPKFYTMLPKQSQTNKKISHDDILIMQ